MKTAAKSGARRRVLIVNGRVPVREEVTLWINRCPDLQVCGQAQGKKATLDQIKRLRPSVVLSEILRPQDVGLIRELHRCHPKLSILAFSFIDEEWYAQQVLEAGACGYIRNGVHGTTFVAGIRKALNIRGRHLQCPGRAKKEQGRMRATVTGANRAYGRDYECHDHLR